MIFWLLSSFSSADSIWISDCSTWHTERHDFRQRLSTAFQTRAQCPANENGYLIVGVALLQFQQDDDVRGRPVDLIAHNLEKKTKIRANQRTFFLNRRNSAERPRNGRDSTLTSQIFRNVKESQFDHGTWREWPSSSG